MNKRISILIPCFNEIEAIGEVVRDFRTAVPNAAVYVYDNNSTDGTADAARDAGAIVRFERLQGKGNVVRRMFADIEADVYVMVDGDGTYDASDAPRLIHQLIEEGLDLVNGRRVQVSDNAFPSGHIMGNQILSQIVAWTFGNHLRDMLSGYKVLSRRFVKSFPLLSQGFEIETELAVHAIELRMPLTESDVTYRERAAGSQSKLKTFHDGFRISTMIVRLMKEERPLAFFAGVSAVLLAVSLSVGGAVISEFIDTGLVTRLPSAVLATGVMLLAFISLACGFILDTVTVSRREIKRLHYLSWPGVHSCRSSPQARPRDSGELGSESIGAVSETS